jgi:hypothetical protein
LELMVILVIHSFSDHNYTKRMVIRNDKC